MSLFDLDYHWRFDPATYVWQLWLTRHLGDDVAFMTCVGRVTAEAEDGSGGQARPFLVEAVWRRLGSHFRLREVA